MAPSELLKGSNVVAIMVNPAAERQQNQLLVQERARFNRLVSILG
jgi:hypothetical protein